MNLKKFKFIEIYKDDLNKRWIKEKIPKGLFMWLTDPSWLSSIASWTTRLFMIWTIDNRCILFVIQNVHLEKILFA